MVGIRQLLSLVRLMIFSPEIIHTPHSVLFIHVAVVSILTFCLVPLILIPVVIIHVINPEAQ